MKKKNKYAEKYLKAAQEADSKKRSKVLGQIGLVALRNRYNRLAPVVLADYLDLRDRERGERRSYDIIKKLPTQEEYTKLVNAKYTTTLNQLLADAIGEIEGLKDEIQEWYDNLPEAFQNGDKGEQLQECIDQFNSLSVPNLPEEKDQEWKTLDAKVTFLPAQGSSRSDRMQEAIRILDFVADQIEDETELKRLYDDLQSLSSDCGDIEFPGMY